MLQKRIANPKHDLKELWSRVVFNMAVSNTDDHLRNHGFLLTETGWILSPVFDMNPVPYGDSLALNVNQNDNTISVENLLETALYYDMEIDTAHRTVKSIFNIVKENWENLTTQYGLGRGDIEYMRPAFSLCQNYED